MRVDSSSKLWGGHLSCLCHRLRERRDGVIANSNLLLEFGCELLVSFEPLKPPGSLIAKLDHFNKGVAVLAPKIGEQVTSGADLLETARVVVDVIDRISQLLDNIIEFGSDRLQAFDHLVERSPATKLRGRFAESVKHPVVAAERQLDFAGPISVFGRIREHILEVFEVAILLRRSQLGVVDLGQLISQ